METSCVDVPILESVTNIAKRNNGAQEVYLYYENDYKELDKIFKIKFPYLIPAIREKLSAST